jgi:Tfp pilus assembly protein PilV
MSYFFSKKHNKSSGFAMIEIVIASAIISTALFVLISVGEKGLVLSERSLKQVTVSYLLEEGGEVVKIFRDNNWSNISDLENDTTYYISFDSNSNAWSISTTSNTVDEVFTRTIVLDEVLRDPSDDISASGTLDENTRQVTISVSWQERGATVSKSLSFYISNIFG